MACFEAIGLVAKQGAYPKVDNIEFEESGLDEKQQKAIRDKVKGKSSTAARNLLGRMGWHVVGIMVDSKTDSTHIMLERQVDA